MTDFRTIVDRLEQGNLTPDEIASYRSYCAAWLYRFYEEVGSLSAEGALWLTANRNLKDRYKSQAECERAWEATESGQKLIKKKALIKGVEHVQEVLTSLWFQTNKELRESSRYGA